MELLEVPYTQFLKLELPSYVNSVISIIQDFDTESLMIDDTFQLLVAKKPQLEKLTVEYKEHPLRKEATKMRKMRSVYLSAISNRLKVVEKEDMTGMNKEVNLVKTEINRFFYDLSSSKNEETKVQKVTAFFELIVQSEEMVAALSSLKFTSYIDELQKTHRIIMGLADDIDESSSKRPTEKTPYLKKVVILALRDFFKELAIAPVKHQDLDYKPLYDRLNKLTTRFKNMVSRRVLANKRKAQRDKNLDTGKNEEVSTETTSPSESAQPLVQKMYSLDTEALNKIANGNGGANGVANENGAGHKLEEKKAEATTSNLLHLPNTENEA